jgi:hypothetical protein
MFDLARPGLKKPLRLLGVVVDTRVGRGLGIRFDGLDKETSDRLGDLIADLGGLTTASLLVDKPDPEPARIAPVPTTGTHDRVGVHVKTNPHGFPAVTAAAPPASSPLPAPVPSPAPSATSYRTNQAATTSTHTPAHATQIPNLQPSENELKLQAQMRSMVMELGRLQELVQQREKELHDARSEIARLQTEQQAGDAAQRIVGRLEIEKGKLEAQLGDLKQRQGYELDAAQREAETAIAAIGRLVESLRRLR